MIAFDEAKLIIILYFCSISSGTGNASLNSVSPIVSHMGHYDVEQGVRYWHLVKPQDDQAPLKDYNHKSIPEIFLTRLLSTKVSCNFKN